MITAIIIFLAVLVGIIIYFMYSFRWSIFVLLLIFVLIICWKVYRNIKRCGSKSIFRAFHQYPNDNEQLNLVEHILTKEQKFHIVLRTNYEILIFISCSGVYLIKVLSQLGRILGESNNETLIVKNGGEETIPNFFLELKKLENFLKIKIPNLVIKKLVIKKGTCLLQIPYLGEYQVIEVHNLYYQLRHWDKKRVYTEDQVQKLSTHVSDCLSNIVKLKENTCTSEETKLQSK